MSLPASAERAQQPTLVEGTALPGRAALEQATGRQEVILSQRLATGLRARAGAVLVGVLFLLLCLYYNATVPLWESDSEWAHFRYVQYIVDKRALPDPDTVLALPDTDDQCRSDATILLAQNNQFRQPPLYYALGAAATAWIDTTADWPLTANPYVFADPSRAGYNFVVHGGNEGLPYEGVELAVHVLRLLSTVIGLSGLVATYLTGLLVFRGRRELAVAVMAVHAFIPQYVFSSAVVNNDILVGALGSWCVYLCTHFLIRGRRPGTLLLAALAAGLATLAKYNGLTLVPLVAGVALVNLARAWRADRKHFKAILWQTTVVAVLAASPLMLWFGRNKVLYGEVVVNYPTLTGAGPGLWSTVEPLRAVQFAFMTFWGLFGVDNIALPPAVLLILAAICLLALTGLFRLVADRRRPAEERLLVTLAMLFLVLAWFVSSLKAVGTSEPRGRYLMPAYSVASFLLVWGVTRMLPARWRRMGRLAFAGSLLTIAVAVPVLLLAPLYRPPALAAGPALSPGDQPLGAVFDDVAELVGYRIEPQRLGVFEKLNVTLVWRALQSTSNNYTVGVYLLDGDNIPHGSVASYPGRGNFATSLWQAGDVFRDSYEVYLGGSVRDKLPSLGRVKVALYCQRAEGNDYLEVRNSAGESLGDAVYVGYLKLAAPPAKSSEVASVSSPKFGDSLSLESIEMPPEHPLPGQVLEMDLLWRALAPPGQDYVLFAHLVDAAGNQVAGNDRPLTGGYYPSSLWETGEVIRHRHILRVPGDLPPGHYQVMIGLYNPLTGDRLPAFDATQAQQPDGQLALLSLDFNVQYYYIPGVQVGGGGEQ